MKKYNPITQILNGEFSLREDLRETVSRRGLENLSLQVTAAVTGAGIYGHDLWMIGIGAFALCGELAYRYLRLYSN